MAKLEKDKIEMVIRTLKERQDALERSLAKFLKREDISEKDLRILKGAIIESIIETKDTIDIVRITGEYGSCSECHKEIPLLFLQDHPCTDKCEECKRAERAANRY